MWVFVVWGLLVCFFVVVVFLNEPQNCWGVPEYIMYTVHLY